MDDVVRGHECVVKIQGQVERQRTNANRRKLAQTQGTSNLVRINYICETKGGLGGFTQNQNINTQVYVA